MDCSKVSKIVFNTKAVNTILSVEPLSNPPRIACPHNHPSDISSRPSSLIRWGGGTRHCIMEHGEDFHALPTTQVYA